MRNCNICGEEIQLDASKRYIASHYNFLKGTEKYECIDCTKCGCQNVLQIRYDELHPDTEKKIEELRAYVCDHLCVHAAEDSEYLEARCKECRLEELSDI